MALESVSEEGARRYVKTDSQGTHMATAAALLQNAGVKCHYISINAPFEECLWWLTAQSFHFPIIISGHWVHKVARKGKARNLYHAVLLADGMAYDPAEREEAPIEALWTCHDKAFDIRGILIFETERPAYGCRAVREELGGY